MIEFIETEAQNNTAVATLPPAARAAVVIQSDKIAAELTALAESSKSIVAITNSAGRTECHAAAMAARQASVNVDKAGKVARDDALAFSKAVIAEVARLQAIINPERDRLLAIRDEWDAKIEAEKEANRLAEAARIDGIKRKIDAIRSIPIDVAGTSALIMSRSIGYLKALEIDDSYAEFFGDAREAKGETLAKLSLMHELAAEKEAAEARAQEEHRLRVEAMEKIRIEQEAEAAMIKAENERVKAEIEVERAKMKAEQDRIKAEMQAEAAKMKAERDALDRERAACEAHAKEQVKETVTDNGTNSSLGTSSVESFNPDDAVANQTAADNCVVAQPAADSVITDRQQIEKLLDYLEDCELLEVLRLIKKIMSRK